MALIVETLTAPAIEVPAEPTTPMKPSEALRLGRLVRPRRVERDYWSGEDGACAAGAIAVGYGIDPLQDMPFAQWNTPCPARRFFGLSGCHSNRSEYPATVEQLVSHLNDDHHWSDDQIVAWLESVGL